MTDDRGGPFGCFFWAIGFFIVLAVLVALPGGGDGGGSGATAPASNDTNSTLSNNELFSRNQANIASDVTNEYYDCNAYGACQFQYDNSQHSVTIAESDRGTFVFALPNGQNAVSMSDGTVSCENPEAPGQFAASFCAQ